MEPQWNPEDLDPVRHCPRRYLKLIRRLQQSGLVHFAAGCRCRVGMLAVKEQNDEQRLVLDARSSSCYFNYPPKVHLAWGEAFAWIEVDPGQQLWFGSVDIQVAIYAMQLPAILMTYFGLPCDVRTGDVVITSLDGVAVPP